MGKGSFVPSCHTHRNKNNFLCDAPSLLWTEVFCASSTRLVPKSGQATRFIGMKGGGAVVGGSIRSVEPCCSLEAYKTFPGNFTWGPVFRPPSFPRFSSLNTRWTCRRYRFVVDYVVEDGFIRRQVFVAFGTSPRGLSDVFASHHYCRVGCGCFVEESS